MEELGIRCLGEGSYTPVNVFTGLEEITYREAGYSITFPRNTTRLRASARKIDGQPPEILDDNLKVAVIMWFLNHKLSKLLNFHCKTL